MAYLRRLAMERWLEGWSVTEIAAWVGVQVQSVRRWCRAFRHRGWSALDPAPVPGRPPKLAPEQRRKVLSWIDQRPEDFGFVGFRWTARRIAWLIAEAWGIRFHPRYLNAWLAEHGISPQRPERAKRERDPVAVARWLRYDWPRIKKTPGGGALP